MKAVNLLPASRARRPGFGGARVPLAAAAAVLAVGAMGWWGWSTHQEVGRTEDRVAAVTVERDALQAELGAFQQADARQAEQALRRGAVVGLAAGRVNWERLVRDLSAVMPRQVWLTNLKGETDPAGASAAAPAGSATADTTVPKGVHLDGYAFTQRQVALLMARAGTVAGLGEPRLASSEVQERAGRTVIHFVIDIPIDQRAQDRPTLTPVTDGGAGAPGGATP